MSRGGRVVVLLAAGVLGIAGVGAQAATPPAATTTTTTTTTPEPEKAEPTDEGRALRRDMLELASAWADGGGRFGYPYWDKAGYRWRSGEISTALYREYVTSYRDRLVVGCDLVDSVDTDGEVADDVHELVSNACSRRIDGLRAQQRWLDELIRRDTGTAEGSDEAIDERLAEREADANEALQESWRDARLAMELAQSELEAQLAEPIPQDSFI